MANGRPIRLRGVNWGWWHLCGTRYSEADMQHLAQWGANTVRLAFSYNDLETDDNPAVFKEDGFKDVDDVARMGEAVRHLCDSGHACHSGRPEPAALLRGRTQQL